MYSLSLSLVKTKTKPKNYKYAFTLKTLMAPSKRKCIYGSFSQVTFRNVD